MNNTAKSPFEIRLELINQARLILSARAQKHNQEPTTEEVVECARELNRFVSDRDAH